MKINALRLDALPGTILDLEFLLHRHLSRRHFIIIPILIIGIVWVRSFVDFFLDKADFWLLVLILVLAEHACCAMALVWV